MPDIFVGDASEDLGKPKVKPGKDFHHKHSHLFAAYCENPPLLKFVDRLPEEEVLLLLRRHLITNIPWIIKAIALGLIPAVAYVFQVFNLFSFNFIPGNYSAIIILFFYSVVLIYIFINYFTWFYNISLVTTSRIIDIDFSSIVFENVAATKLTQVEDVSYSQIGVIRSIFDYGDVLTQTAGAKDVFELLAVPHPEKVIKIINNLLGEARNA